MSRLHAFPSDIAAIAARFGVSEPPELVVPDETIEGLPGLVVLESGGHRRIKAPTWGFPRLTHEMRMRGDPPSRIGLVADLTNPMWESLVVNPRYRCLIPIAQFANPDGIPGAMTRTWYSVKDQPIMAWAGFVRNTPAFGPVYAGMTMAANEAVMPTNDRMPVLLDAHEQDRWLRGSIQDVIHFQFRAPIAAERMDVLPTEALWRSGKPRSATQPRPAPQLALL